MGAMLPLAAFARQAGPDLTKASLEDLLSMEVTSVSRHQEDIMKTPAAVYVITHEDIRRSGVTDVAELLRMVPGIQVAQIESSIWAVGARGFNAEYSTKLLILVDGRTVYDPTFSGVYWRLQNFVLEDIERIEVIRGPGATMWGANAVNGVISITTKRAADTHGGLLVADAGTGRPADGSLRFGGSLGANASYRVFSRQTTRSSLLSPSGASGGDSWNLTDGGFRVDWNPAKADSVTVESSAYRGVIGRNQPVLVSLSPLSFEGSGLGNTGGNVLTRWSHSFKNSSNLTFQAYYDNSRIKGFSAEDIQTLDFDFQYSFKIGSRNDVVLGLGRREYSETFHNSLSIGMTPSNQNIDITSGFVQEEALSHYWNQGRAQHVHRGQCAACSASGVAAYGPPVHLAIRVARRSNCQHR
jgi:iron complex outermembrane receptor protein